MGGKVASIVVIAFVGVIIADVLLHPTGTKAFFSGGTSALKATYSAMLGKQPR